MTSDLDHNQDDLPDPSGQRGQNVPLTALQTQHVAVLWPRPSRTPVDCRLVDTDRHCGTQPLSHETVAGRCQQWLQLESSHWTVCRRKLPTVHDTARLESLVREAPI